MKKYLFIFLLMLTVLACALTDSPTGATLAQDIEPTKTQPTKSPITTPTSSPLLCTVSTGYPGGRLRLRDCGSTQCQELDLLDEGETLTIESLGDWLKVTSSSGRSGWINSNYCKLSGE